MTNLEMYALVVGFLLPPLIAIVQQPTWPEWARAVMTFLVCALAGAGTAYFQGDLTGRRFVEAGLVVLVTTIATFKGFWKPTGVAPAVEAKTTLPG